MDIHIGATPPEHSIKIGGQSFNLAKSLVLDTGGDVGGTVTFDCFLPHGEPTIVEGRMRTDRGDMDVYIAFAELSKVRLNGEWLTSNTRLFGPAVRATVWASGDGPTDITIEYFNRETHKNETIEGYLLPTEGEGNREGRA